MSLTLAATPGLAGAADSLLEVLVFRLGAEEYAVDIQAVRELRGRDPITRIANAPEWIKGVINLRGTIVPIADLRTRLALDAAVHDPLSVVMIVNVDDRLAGVVVDGVSEVTAVPQADIKPSPLPDAADRSWLLGVCECGGRLLQLVDMQRLLAGAPVPLAHAA